MLRSCCTVLLVLEPFFPAWSGKEAAPWPPVGLFEARRIHEEVRTVLAAELVSAGQVGALGDAARKADESRKGATPRSFTQRDLVAVEWIITPEGLEDYAIARVEVAEIRRKNTGLHQRLFEASRRASSLAALAPALSSDPSIVHVLSKYKLTSREYLRREQALVNATAWAAEKRLPAAITDRPIRIQNVEFVRANDKLVRDTMARYQKAEGSPPWFNPARFVDKP